MSGFSDLFSSLPVVGDLSKFFQGQPIGGLSLFGDVAGPVGGLSGGLGDALTFEPGAVPGTNLGPPLAGGAGLGDFGAAALSGLGERVPSFDLSGILGSPSPDLAPFISTPGSTPGTNLGPDLTGGPTTGDFGAAGFGGAGETVPSFDLSGVLGSETGNLLQSSLGLATNPETGELLQSGIGASEAPNALTSLPGGGAVAPPAPGAGGSTPGTEGVLGGISDFLKKNKGLLTALGIGADVGKAALFPPTTPAALRQNIPQAAQQTGQAATTALAQGQALAPSLATGQLSPGGENLVQNQLRDEQTAIRSKYAQLGLSGSTAEQQDLSQAEQRNKAFRFQLAQQETNSGLQALQESGALSGEEAQLYSEIANAKLAGDQELVDALTNAVSSLALSEGLSSLRK